MFRIYLFRQQERIDEAFFMRALSLLPLRRREKALRYRCGIDRKNCVVSWLLLRTALYECFGITDFALRYGECGKPFLAGRTDVFFSISHCAGGCAVAVADRPIGVDIEKIRPLSREAANLVCTRRELALLEEAKDGALLFTRIWTGKESRCKMTGEGISEALAFYDVLQDETVSTVEYGGIVISVCLKGLNGE